MTQKYEAIQEYEVEIAASRQHFEHHPAVRTVCYEEIDSKTLAAILIYFSALGVAMTEVRYSGPSRSGEGPRCSCAT